MVHTVLEIVKGCARVPGDNLSAEVGLDSIDLLDPVGFSCDSYEMVIPSLKGGSTWADSNITDGRTLVSAAYGNVTETIRLNLTAGTLVQMAAMLSKLARFRLDVGYFWDTLVQIEPVYLKHQVEGEPGPRYALLYDIDIAITSPVNPGEAKREVVLVIEREVYWRGLAPGDNPKHWSILVNNQSWTASNAHLLQGNDALHQGNISNRAEQNSGASGYVTQNFLDIPASKIPGDAPALLNVSIQQAVSVSATALLIGKATKPTSGNTSRNTSANQLTVYSFNAADGTTGTDTSLAADTGVPMSHLGVRNRSVTTFGTATMLSRLDWQSSNHPNGFSSSVMRGRYAVFLRARLSAANTSCDIQLSVMSQVQNDVFTTTPVTITDQGAGGTGNSTDWGLLYLGYVGVPVSEKRVSVAPDGKGIWIDTAQVDDLVLSVQASRTTGAGSLYMSDLIFVPMDEGMIEIVSSIAVGSGAVVLYSWHYDNTGYFLHGTPGDYATIDFYSTASIGHNMEADIPELSGGPIYLTPKVQNRLVFLMYVKATKRSIYNDPSASTVRVNIIPRWVGYRDE